jgi:hypothetical protein
VLDCRDDQYLDSKLDICHRKEMYFLMALIACHRSCRKCDGPEKQNCLKCLPQMFFANSSLWGRLCVTNCESVGMYNDEGLNKCVGCHPTCEPDKCFGPSNTQCYDCAPGFVRYDKYTCDTECMPENSFIRGEEECVCMPYPPFLNLLECHESCRKCYGTN